ncbi:uncharacterized protein LOC125720409 isoform X3 [Brienomyrus brachyistius]|uniref:uncharacterized protein LOC125720409 isoform X3 n=1 Tax=Brienomyrus brachyistius TaxID=42636 RepID=UPI0020B225BE|nr:uncharacterized protein LOC125720409 isoform X3 [Brienomyrus brachyistius]
MDTTCISLIVLLGLGCSTQERRSEEAELRIVRLGDSITLHCDVKHERETIWYRQCSHENQPLLKMARLELKDNPHPRYAFVWDSSSNSYSLLIKNITKSDLGLYYCSTKYLRFSPQPNGTATDEATDKFGGLTIRLLTADDSNGTIRTPSGSAAGMTQSWVPVLSVTVAVLLCAPLSLGTYWLGKRQGLKQATAKQRITRFNDEEEEEGQLNYATLKIRKGPRPSRKKPDQNSDSCTYSEVYRGRV